MTQSAAGEVTDLLDRWRAGERDAGEQVLARLYTQLRQIARRQLLGERAGHTLQATALVNEALLRLLGERNSEWKNRGQVLALAAQAMRRVLVDHARRQAAEKRPDPRARISFSRAEGVPVDDTVDVLQLDRALDELATIEPRQARIVELRYFAGLSSEQVAQALDVSLATVNRDWRVARAWLRLTLQGQE